MHSLHFAVRRCIYTLQCRLLKWRWSKPRTFVVENDRLLLGFAHGTTLEVLELQVEGKKRMSARDFANGYRPRSEETLGATA